MKKLVIANLIATLLLLIAVAGDFAYTFSTRDLCQQRRDDTNKGLTHLAKIADHLLQPDRYPLPPNVQAALSAEQAQAAQTSGAGQATVAP